jgi:hypothetical protein
VKQVVDVPHIEPPVCLSNEDKQIKVPSQIKKYLKKKNEREASKTKRPSSISIKKIKKHKKSIK